MSRDRGVQPDIWERHEREHGLTLRKIKKLIRELEPASPVFRSRPAGKPSKAKRDRGLKLVTSADKPTPVRELQGAGAERIFLEQAESRGAKVYRAGWPDYLLEFKGRTIGVEVKDGSDVVSSRQAKMFAALERVGIRVYIWNRLRHDRLTPWRRYVVDGCGRDPY